MTTLEIILTFITGIVTIFAGSQSILFFRQTKRLKALENKEKEQDIDAKASDGWQELVAEQQNALDGVSAINCMLILTYNQDASDHAYVYGLDGKLRHQVTLPSVGSVGFSGKKDQPECFYSFTSFTQPGTIYRYDIENDKSTIYYAPKVAFKLDNFTSEQVFFESKDGTRIPMFLTYKKGMKPRLSLWLWRFQHFTRAWLLSVTHPVPREWRHLCSGEPARWRRIWRSMASGRHQDAEAECL